MDWVDKPQNYKDLYGSLQTLRGSNLNNFLRKTLKLGWVAFHSVTFQLKCLHFQSNQCKKLVPVLARLCNCLFQLFLPKTDIDAKTVITGCRENQILGSSDHPTPQKKYT